MTLLWSLLAGALAGLGIYALLRVFLRPKPGVATLVARIDAGRKSMRSQTTTALERSRGISGFGQSLNARVTDFFEVQATDRGWQLGKVRNDLAIMGRSAGQFLATKLFIGLGLFLLAPFVWGVLRLLSVPLPSAIPLVLAVVLGLVGFFLPDLALRQEADRRRKDFRKVVGVFLDLVAMNLAGGRGLPEALLAASTVSEHWSLVRIRQALANARLFGVTPWEALGVLGEEIAIDELRDLAGALGLAADDGAKIRSSLSARAATLRAKELSSVEGKEGERSQSMLVAQLLLSAGFLVFLAYPAIAQLLGAQ
ncbi:type II secretion system protein [Saxibacter everestensis]|uniref:Type II secretion system protein n=1 Tax=Saxibacter everestensis TaxID=2909229 RepID=A0ABY8QWH5_9MICO|nr:type II secretion system protein [Brevibacteriaceae bacterium ZFBP1038]